MSASSSAVVDISRSKKRYKDLDNLLKGFVGFDGSTAKEIAVDVLGWSNERYSNAPKRCHDLQARGYLDLLDGRVCRHTGKVAHTYKITAAGLDYLKNKGIVLPVVSVPVLHGPVNSRAIFSDLKLLLSN